MVIRCTRSVKKNKVDFQISRAMYNQFSIFFAMLAHLSQWKHTESPIPKKARQVRSNVKVLLTVFFDYHGVVERD